MIRLTDIIKDDILYEGLIYSTEIDTTSDYLSRWSIASNKFSTKMKNNNTIDINLKSNFTKKEFTNFMVLINNLGWYISTYIINKFPLRRKKFNDTEFLSNDFDKPILNFNLEAKFDLEKNRYELDYLYHISPKKHEEKIKKIGLVPKSKEKISSHPERIYLAPSLNDCKILASKFEKDIQYTIYEIDVKELRKYNNGIRFFRDPLFVDSLYTLSNVPPQFLNIIEYYQPS